VLVGTICSALDIVRERIVERPEGRGGAVLQIGLVLPAA
jgi:hypothetical protein